MALGSAPWSTARGNLRPDSSSRAQRRRRNRDRTLKVARPPLSLAGHIPNLEPAGTQDVSNLVERVWAPLFAIEQRDDAVQRCSSSSAAVNGVLADFDSWYETLFGVRPSRLVDGNRVVFGPHLSRDDVVRCRSAYCLKHLLPPAEPPSQRHPLP